MSSAVRLPGRCVRLYRVRVVYAISRAASAAASAATGRQEAAEGQVSELRKKVAAAEGRTRELEVQLAALTRQSEGAKADAAANIGLQCIDPSRHSASNACHSLPMLITAGIAATYACPRGAQGSCGRRWPRRRAATRLESVCR